MKPIYGVIWCMVKLEGNNQQEMMLQMTSPQPGVPGSPIGKWYFYLAKNCDSRWVYSCDGEIDAHLPWWIVGLIWGILLQRLLFESKILFKCALPFGYQTYFHDFGIRLFASNEPPFGRPHTPPRPAHVIEGAISRQDRRLQRSAIRHLSMKNGAKLCNKKLTTGRKTLRFAN